MKKIKLSYSNEYNAGDLLNIGLVEKLGECRVERSKVYNADLLAIGGAIFGAQYSNNLSRKICQKALELLYGNKPLFIWGSGFLYSNNENELYRKNLHVCALRGDLTRQKLAGLTGQSYENVPLADAGLLVDLLLTNEVEKKYRIGVVPHFSQKNDPIFDRVYSDEHYHFIDIQRDPKSVAEDIASCEYIVSSSLHGLVFADSLHVPSLHLIGKTPLHGGIFKYEDYYSAYGLEDTPWTNSEELPTVNDIIDGCKIDYNIVEEKKKLLVDSFPRFEE